MQLPTEIRAKMIHLWRPVLLAGFMHGHLNPSEEYGCRRGAIILKRNLTTCRGDFLWATATMTLNKYSEHGTEEGGILVPYTSEDKKSVRDRYIRVAAIDIAITQGIWSIYYLRRWVINHHSFLTIDK
jgi:hypothetical protein